MNELISNNLVEQIKNLLEASRQKIAVEVNTTLLHTYWQIGKIIVEDEALHIGDVEYEKQSLRQLSKALTTEFGNVTVEVSNANILSIADVNFTTEGSVAKR